MTASSSGREKTPGTPTGSYSGHVRVASWNLLRRVGARAQDVARLISVYHPDLVLLQEATEEISQLPSLVGGHFFRHPMQKRIYGLAAWSPHAFPPTSALHLPMSVLPAAVPRRMAQIVKFHGISFANVHLSHGQFLNRFQLAHIANALEGPAVIMGDFNAVGPIVMPDFRDIGPRQWTHKASNVVSLRLDRCMGREVRCISAAVLDKGPSDHHPILLELVHAAHMLPSRAQRAID
ncbi:MAG TPA: endonuclease/exonuclease/phosphatase family protein [Rhizomicrobium sp.]|nr:endonuclease/exonuclease/phosphatase family protein [Rhizomicrobium sp.]